MTKAVIDYDRWNNHIGLDFDDDVIRGSEDDTYGRHYVVDAPTEFVEQYNLAKAAWDAIRKKLFEIHDECEGKEVDQRNAEYAARKSGMTREQIVAEVNRRLAKHPECDVKCRHCHPGRRVSIGNCIVCGNGPAPASITFMGLEEMLIHEVNAAFTN